VSDTVRALTKFSAEEILAKLRECGWSVAVHNDYRLKGESYTFWLLTHPEGIWAKGEGATDKEALEEAFERGQERMRNIIDQREQMRSLLQAAYDDLPPTDVLLGPEQIETLGRIAGFLGINDPDESLIV